MIIKHIAGATRDLVGPTYFASLEVWPIRSRDLPPLRGIQRLWWNGVLIYDASADRVA